MRKAISTTELFEVLGAPKLETLVATAAAYGPRAFTDLSPGGDSLHASALARFMACVVTEGAAIQDWCDCLSWLIEQRAPYQCVAPEMGVAFYFCQANWSGTKHADAACEMMAQYIESMYLDPNSPVQCARIVPALAATFYCANPAAARVLLDGGADEALALKGSGHTALAAYAASFGHWSSGMVAATVTEFQMQRRIDSARVIPVADSDDKSRRRLSL